MVVLPTGLDRKIVKFRDGLRAAVDIDVVLELPDLRGSRRKNQVLGTDGIHDIRSAKDPSPAAAAVLRSTCTWRCFPP